MRPAIKPRAPAQFLSPETHVSLYCACGLHPSCAFELQRGSGGHTSGTTVERKLGGSPEKTIARTRDQDLENPKATCPSNERESEELVESAEISVWKFDA